MLVGRLLGNPPAAAQDAAETRTIMHYGYTDLAGQLRSALDQFSGLGLVSFWVVVGLVIAYIVLIGPADYFFLRRVCGRMVLTWVTFPLIVLAFCVGAYFAARWFKGDEIRVNQADVIDVDAATGRIRGTAWASVFSPRTDRYDFAFQPKLPSGKTAQEARTLTAWLGLPGSGLGGMDPATANPASWKEQYDFSGRLDTLSGVPVAIWSTKSLTARWTARTDVCPEAELSEEERILTGTITNTLSFPLSDCILAYGRWGYELGELKPGQSARVGAMARRRDLETLLTGRKLEFTEGGKDKFRLDPTPLYDQSSVDLAYVLRAMIFFHAAGGQRFTGLSNEYQSFVDLSGLLKTSRAILVGRPSADMPAAQRSGVAGGELLCNGRPVAGQNDRRLTIYRFVFPVKMAKAESTR